jgi:hypothetical protein
MEGQLAFFDIYRTRKFQYVKIHRMDGFGQIGCALGRGKPGAMVGIFVSHDYYGPIQEKEVREDCIEVDE